MICSVDIQMPEAVVAVEELDASVEVAKAYLPFPVEFDAGSLVDADSVAVRVQSHIEVSCQIYARLPLAVEPHTRREMSLVIVYLNAVLHGPESFDGLNVEADDLRRLGSGVI